MGGYPAARERCGLSAFIRRKHLVPDNGFLDRLYGVYKNRDPNLEYRVNKIEYLFPAYEKIRGKLCRGVNAFRSICELRDDSSENYTGEKGACINGSCEGRPVYEIRYGDKSGVPVIVWSQMHGTESTGTRALMDIFEFLLAEKDEELNPEDREMAESLRAALSSLNIHFIPLMNPDGANNWQRSTMQNMSGRHPALFVSGTNNFPADTPALIDLNRDAWTMESPEARLLWRAFANFDRAEGEKQPLFAFTLHDQGSSSVGGYDTPAAISLLSPAANGAKHFNDPRYRATQIIQKMDMEQVQIELPNMSSRYTDDWGPVYFGDSFTMAGAGVILIESGNVKLDPEKTVLRRTNFKAILRGLWEMAGDYEKIDPVDWTPPEEFNKKANTANAIPKPPSRRVIYDVLLRNVLAPNGNEYNLGINRQLNVLQYNGEHRSLWYYSSGFADQGSDRAFHDNLANNSVRLDSGSRPSIPYLVFNNGHGDSVYSNPGSAGDPNPVRYWGDTGYPSDLGMCFDPVWPAPAAADSGACAIDTGSRLKEGDSVSFGFEELDCGAGSGNLKIQQAVTGGRDPVSGNIVIEGTGKTAPAYQRVEDITLAEAWALLRVGACAVRVCKIPDGGIYNLPLLVLIGENTQPPTISAEADSGQNNFILADRQNGEAKYAVIGGYLIDLSRKPAYPIWGIRDGDQAALPLAGFDGDDGKYADSYQGHFRNVVIRECSL